MNKVSKMEIEQKIEVLYNARKKAGERINQFILEQEKIIERIDKEIAALKELEEKDQIDQEPDEKINYERIKKLAASSETNEVFLDKLYMFVNNSKELNLQKKNIIISLILGNENVSEMIIVKERKKDYLGVNNQIADNPKTPQYLLEDLFFSTSKGYKVDKRRILLNPSITKKIMLYVARKNNIEFYGYLISNRATLEEVLMILTLVLIKEKELKNSKTSDEMLNGILLHPNVSERIINVIKEKGGIRNFLAVKDKKNLLIGSFTYSTGKHLISPEFYNKETKQQMEVLEETLKFSKSELFEMKRNYCKIENVKEYIEWVETLGYSFKEEIW